MRSFCGGHFNWATSIYAATNHPPRLRSRRKEGGAGPLGGPSPALSCRTQNSRKPAGSSSLREVAPSRAGPEAVLAFGSGGRVTGQAERLLAGKSRCLAEKMGAILPPEDSQASTPLPFIFKIDLQTSLRREDLWSFRAARSEPAGPEPLRGGGGLRPLGQVGVASASRLQFSSPRGPPALSLCVVATADNQKPAQLAPFGSVCQK